jgi:hypothetical protein
MLNVTAKCFSLSLHFAVFNDVTDLLVRNIISSFNADRCVCQKCDDGSSIQISDSKSTDMSHKLFNIPSWPNLSFEYLKLGVNDVSSEDSCLHTRRLENLRSHDVSSILMTYKDVNFYVVNKYV